MTVEIFEALCKVLVEFHKYFIYECKRKHQGKEIRPSFVCPLFVQKNVNIIRFPPPDLLMAGSNTDRLVLGPGPGLAPLFFNYDDDGSWYSLA